MPLRIEIERGDITEAATDAIVNAANNHLWMGSGVAGAIKSAGGSGIEKEAIAKGPIEVGEAVATTAGRLPHQYVIHAAGMGQDLMTDPDIVYEVTQSSLEVADRLGLKSIAFPAIGTGVGGLSLTQCADSMIWAAKDYEHNLENIEFILFVLFDIDSFMIFDDYLKKRNN